MVDVTFETFKNFDISHLDNLIRHHVLFNLLVMNSCFFTFEDYFFWPALVCFDPHVTIQIMGSSSLFMDVDIHNGKKQHFCFQDVEDRHHTLRHKSFQGTQ
jgi:hypothetical protein